MAGMGYFSVSGFLPLYALMGLSGFAWGLQHGFDAYYPKPKQTRINST